jgi:hypothetical protein
MHHDIPNVMAALVAAIHVFRAPGMAGTGLPALAVRNATEVVGKSDR